MKSTSKTLNIVQALKRDHREIKLLFSRILKTSARATQGRKVLFSRLHDLIASHAKSEEEVVYEPMKLKKSVHMKVLEGYEEHHVADLLLGELSKLSVGDEQWTAKMVVLQEALEHHIGEEEKELLPKVEKNFSDTELLSMGDAFLSKRRGEDINAALIISGVTGMPIGVSL